MVPFKGASDSTGVVSGGSSDSEDELERRRRGSDADEDEELQNTDDEQDRKEITAVPFPKDEQQSEDELQALIIEDLKTVVNGDVRPPVYARRRVQKGSVVVVRGSEGGDTDDEATEATWVALVNKVYRENGELRVGVTWFNRKSDIPAKEARRAKLAGDGPLQLLFSNAQDSIEAKYIRHPATAWFLPAGTAPPRMRCGSGRTRHERARPGFLVQRAYDSEGEKVYNIGAPDLHKDCPALAKEVERLVQQSQRELARLQRQETEYDAKHGTTGTLLPLALHAEAAPKPSESESDAEPSSSSSSSDSDDEFDGRLADQAAALASKAAAAADAKRRRQEEAAERAAAAEAQKQRQLQEAVDAEALRLAELLPQQAPQAEQQPGQQQAEQQGQQPEQAAQQPEQQQQQGAAGPAGGAQALTSPGSAGGWRRYAQQLQKHAGRLPWRTAGGPGPAAAAAAKLTAEQAAARDAADVQSLLQGCCTPSPQPLAALLRAVCNCTQAATQGLFTEQVQLFFGRVLLTWLWHLVSLQLPDLQEAAKADPAATEAAAEVASCIELLLQALERQRYTPAYDKWLGLVQGHKLISALARNVQGAYPPGVQQAATQLKELWSARAFKMREHLRQRQQQKQAEQKREAAKERAETQLLQRSPLAGKAAALATSGLRATALGAGGATYVRPRHSPSPAAAAKLKPPPVLATLAGPSGAAAQPPPQQRRLSLSGAAAANFRDQQQEQPSKLPSSQQQQQQPGKPAQPQQMQQHGKPVHAPQQPGKPAQAPQQPGKPAQAAQQQPKAAADAADPLSAAWMNAFKSSSPRGTQGPLARSATAPVHQAAAIAKAGTAAAAGVGTGAPAPHVPRSISAPERDPRQQAAAAAAASTAAAAQKQGSASSTAAGAAGGGNPSKAPMDVADAAPAELAALQAKQKSLKRAAPEVIDLVEAAEQRAAKQARTAAKPPAAHPHGNKGHNKLAALVKKASGRRQGGR